MGGTDLNRASPEELHRRFLEAWPKLVDRTIDPGAGELEFNFGGQIFTIALLEKAAPRICEAFLKILPLEGHIIHAAWSGEVIRQLESFELPVQKPENATYYCAPGDVCYTLGHREFTMMYGDNNCRMPYGNVQESVFGVIKDRMREYQRQCQMVRLLGATPFVIRRK